MVGQSFLRVSGQLAVRDCFQYGADQVIAHLNQLAMMLLMVFSSLLEGNCLSYNIGCI